MGGISNGRAPSSPSSCLEQGGLLQGDTLSRDATDQVGDKDSDGPIIVTVIVQGVAVGHQGC